MRCDRDTTDRGSACDRDGSTGITQLLASITDTSSDAYARLRIDHLITGDVESTSDVHGALLLALAAYCDSGTDVYARIQIDQNLSGYADIDSDVHARLQITHLLKLPDYNSTLVDYGRSSCDKTSCDRQYTQTTDCPTGGTISDTYARLQLTNLLAAITDTSSDIHARLRIDHLMAGYVDTSSDVHGALLLALAAYINSDSSVFARLQVGHNLSGYVDTESDAYARLQITSLLAALTDTSSDVYGRMQITHNLGAITDTTSDVYAMLRQIDSWTITFTGTLAAGKTVCINTRDYTVKNDGVNAIADFSGDFPAMFPGTNWVIYTDTEGSRTLRIVISKRDRKV
jgi:hypothetical protein